MPMTTKTHTDRLIADAIARSVSHTEIAPLTVSGYDISDLLCRIELAAGADCGYTQENDGSYDVWSVDGKPFRLTVTIEATTDDIVDAVANSGVCCPEVVCDAVLYIARDGGDWEAELAKAKASDAEERRALGM